MYNPPTQPPPPPPKAPGYEYPEPDLSLGLAAGQAGNKVKPTTTTTPEPIEGLSLEAAGQQAAAENHDDGHYHHDDHEDHSKWDIRKSVPGEPGRDYPTLDKIPDTGFSCDGRADGYYADVATRCQVYHVCTAQGVPVKNSFMCNNGSIFNQERFVCDWWPNVDCPNSESSYDLNLEIGKTNAQGGSSSDSTRQASYSGASYNSGNKAAASNSYNSGSKAAASNSYNSGSFPSADSSASSGSSSGFSSGSSSFSGNAQAASGNAFGSGGSYSPSALSADAPGAIAPQGPKASVAAAQSNGIESDDSLASSLASSLPSSGPSGASAPAEEPSLSSSLDDNSLYRQSGASSASSSSSASASAEGALSYPGPSAGFSADIATAGIDLRSGFSSSGSGRLNPAATSSLRASFARSRKEISGADEGVVAAGSSEAVVRFGERLPKTYAANAAGGPAKDLEAPTFKRRRFVVTRRRRVPVHEKRSVA